MLQRVDGHGPGPRQRADGSVGQTWRKGESPVITRGHRGRWSQQGEGDGLSGGLQQFLGKSERVVLVRGNLDTVYLQVQNYYEANPNNYLPYSQKYWEELNLAVEPKIAIARILADLNLAVWYGIAIHIHVYVNRKFAGLIPSQIFRLYGMHQILHKSVVGTKAT